MISKRTPLGTSCPEKGHTGWNGLYRPDAHLLAFLVDALNRKSRLVAGNLVDNLNGTWTLSGVKVVFALANGTVEAFTQAGNLVLTPNATRKLLVVNRAAQGGAAIEEIALPGQDPGVNQVDQNGNVTLVDGADNTNLTANENLFPLLHLGQHQDTAQALANFCIWVAPTTGALDWGIPVGTIVMWFPGYFSAADNGGVYTSALIANNLDAADAYLSPRGWRACRGTALSLADSPLLGGDGHYLPNLTDDRFLMGGTTAGGKGGNSVMLDHTHLHALTAASGGSGHDHSMNGSSVVVSWGSNAWVLTTHNAAPASWQDHSTTTTFSGGEHAHSVTGTVGTGSVASATENRPKYLTSIPIMKVA